MKSEWPLPIYTCFLIPDEGHL
uniref:Uncharacterized protein n=1 Tax=Rhizophora mucronata TaxID=61149 RepID=A0A2P2R3F8_RHIMU